MTAKSLRLGPGVADPASIANLIDASLRPGGTISLSFADGIIQVLLDQSGEWTINTGLLTVSNRLRPLTRTLEELGFFRATEQAGVVYHLWTSALNGENGDRAKTEDTLLKLLRAFQSHYSPSYIS